jgi:hypothetical protein
MEAVNMAGQSVRTTSIYKALRQVARLAKRCDERAEAWKKEYGEGDEMRRAELIRAEAYREAVQHMAEELDLDMAELWPDLIAD